MCQEAGRRAVAGEVSVGNGGVRDEVGGAPRGGNAGGFDLFAAQAPTRLPEKVPQRRLYGVAER